MILAAEASSPEESVPLAAETQYIISGANAAYPSSLLNIMTSVVSSTLIFEAMAAKWTQLIADARRRFFGQIV